jgi:CubicO group peptidase (beta-lactamase class C family)
VILFDFAYYCSSTPDFCKTAFFNHTIPQQSHLTLYMKNYLSAILLLLEFATCSAQNHRANLTRLKRIQEAEKSIVLLNNKSGILPVRSVEDLRIASIHAGYGQHAVFDSIASKYQAVSTFAADNLSDSAFFALHDKLKLFNLIIVQLSDALLPDERMLAFIKEQEKTRQVVVVFSGNGKALEVFDKYNAPLVWLPQNSPEAASVAAQLIFGGITSENRLDATYSKIYKKGSGFDVKKTRLGYSVPEAAAINSDHLNAVDSLVTAGITAHAAPSVVVLMAKDGKVIFHKAYGKHTYDGNTATGADDLFDLASVTKVSATTPAIMHLYDQKIIDLEDPVSKYVALTRNIADKADVKIKEALLHEAGYTPYIKFYEQLKPLDMRCDSSALYPTKVADHYYLRANYFNEVMWPATLKSSGNTRGKFVYSDVSMYMMKEVIETATHQTLNDYVHNTFYKPLGMQTTGFLPRNRFGKSRIVPTTENDNWFRNMLVQGYTNDPGAAMAGGVQGHAGLFSNANDLAILFQMYLNKGTYGGTKFFEPATVDLFTSVQSKNSGRGYGFAKADNKQNTKQYPSAAAYGHSGYTGTYVWVDPAYNLVYIILTNRVYPDDNKTFGKPAINLRPMILDIFYEAVLQGQKKDTVKNADPQKHKRE